MRLKVLVLVSLALAACHSSSDSDQDFQPTPLAFNLELAGERVFGAGELRLVAVSEDAQGEDLDGDGDTSDLVLHVLDLENFALGNAGLAIPRSFPRDVVPPPEPAACSDALGAFLVSEAETGEDLDLDGDPTEVTTWIFDRRATFVRNLHFAHSELRLGGELAAFLERDVTGSASLHVYDSRDESLTTLALEPSALLAVSGDIVAFTRDEADVSDLNADGDAADHHVLHLYVADSRRVVNTSFAILPSSLRIEDGFAVFNVSEFENGFLDLDGDGRIRDPVLVAVDPRTGLTRIPGLRVRDIAEVFLPAFDSDPASMLLAVSEDDLDRNGDGDTLDRVLVRYEPRSDRIRDTGLAVALDVPVAPMGASVQSQRWIGALVFEEAQGELDLDGDGHVESGVPHVFDTLTGRTHNLGFGGLWLAALEQQLLGLRIGIAPAEFELVAWDARTHSVRHTGIDARNVLGSAGDDAMVTLAEGAEDLNGDGDTLDFVLALYEGRTGKVRSLRIATSIFEGTLAPGGWAAVLVSERAQGRDLNADGDLRDQVLHQIFLDPPRG